jgi:hypothetical protein
VWWFDCEGIARRKQMAGRIVMLDAKLSANMLQLASVLPFRLSISDAACLALRLTDKHGRHTILPLGLAMTVQQMRLPETFDSKKNNALDRYIPQATRVLGLTLSRRSVSTSMNIPSG